MSFISVSYEFFQLIINIYYDNLVTLSFDFQLMLIYVIFAFDRLCFYNVKLTCKSQCTRSLTTPDFTACPKTYSSQCSTPTSETATGEGLCTSAGWCGTAQTLSQRLPAAREE